MAQDIEAHGSSTEVNAGVVQLQFAFLSGETPEAQADRGVSRGRSTSQAREGRPEPDRCHSTTGPQPTATTPNGRAVALEESEGKHGEAQVNLLEQMLNPEIPGYIGFVQEIVRVVGGLARKGCAVIVGRGANW